MSWRSVHLVVGLLVVAVFLGTGAYMRMQFPELYGDNEVIRYQYRANHIDILSCGLVHVLLGTYLGRAAARRPRLAAGGSVLLLLAAPLLVTAFCVDPPRAGPNRMFTSAGIFALAGGVALHVLGGRAAPAPPEEA